MLDPKRAQDEAERLAQIVRDWFLDTASKKALKQVRFADPDFAIEVAAKTARLTTGTELARTIAGGPDAPAGKLKVEVILSWLSQGGDNPWAVRVEATRL